MRWLGAMANQIGIANSYPSNRAGLEIYSGTLIETDFERVTADPPDCYYWSPAWAARSGMAVGIQPDHIARSVRDASARW